VIGVRDLRNLREMRRRAGIAFVIAGVTLVSIAGSRYALGAVRADSARELWDHAEAREAVARAHATVADARSAGPLVAGVPVARLVIPRIHLDDIVLEGVSDDQLDAGPGHFPGSALPGEHGNAVISAHRDRHFSHFDQLNLGDTVVTEAAGRRTRWTIVSRRVIHKDAPAIFTSNSAELTLTTCWPIRYFGSAPDRLIITAKPLPAA
jgi:sortase A